MLPRQTLLLASSLLLAAALPARAVVEMPQRPWMKDRTAGRALEDQRPPDPKGWKLGTTISSPYSLGLGLGYLVPTKLFTFKGGLDWGITNELGVTALQFQDWRLYGALMYYFVPGANDGPYVETGLDVARSHGGVLDLVNWPVVPHLGFGTILRFGDAVVIDVNFAATANGLLTLQLGWLFDSKNSDNGPLPPWDPPPQP